MRRVLFTIALLICAGTSAPTQELSGQLSGWLDSQKYKNHHGVNTGIRYLPRFTAPLINSNNGFLDIEIAFDLYAFYRNQYQPGSASDKIRKDIDPYRIRMRWATPHFEAVLGLQKISFGPAKLLRSLMWFDRLDPRDPLRLTDGVYALRMRYTFNNNTNIWGWAIYGEDKTRGWDVSPGKKGSGEFGGRLQLPLPLGEIGWSGHSRIATWHSQIQPHATTEGVTEFYENRLGLDGFFDLGIGVWFESAFIHRNLPKYLESFLPVWDTYITLGADYTITWGNGIYLMTEHLVRQRSDQLFIVNNIYHLSGFSASYPLNFLDEITFYHLYDWEQKTLFNYLSWQRRLDNWIFNVAFFTSSNNTLMQSFSKSQLTYSGDLGGRIMLVFNH